MKEKIKGIMESILKYTNQSSEIIFTGLTIKNFYTRNKQERNDAPKLLELELRKSLIECKNRKPLVITLKKSLKQKHPVHVFPYIEIRMIRVDYFDNFIDWDLVDSIMVAMAYTTFCLNGKYIEASPLEIYCDDFEKIPGESFGFDEWKKYKWLFPEIIHK